MTTTFFYIAISQLVLNVLVGVWAGWNFRRLGLLVLPLFVLGNAVIIYYGHVARSELKKCEESTTSFLTHKNYIVGQPYFEAWDANRWYPGTFQTSYR